MHRLILDAKDGELTDHKDRNGLNNYRYNIRIASPATNSQNQKKRKDAIHSQYKGVSKNGRKFRAKIAMNGIQYHLGYFEDEIEAAIAYDLKALELYGIDAALNFKADIGVGATWGTAK